jgi:DNA-binding response OmpR family regulator
MTAPDVRSPAAPLHILLVVEDDILIRFQICDYLRECGFKVIEVANADEAILILREPEFKVDLVLSNVRMPGSMDGFGLAQWMRKEKPGVPIILAGSPAKAADAAGDLCEEGPMLAKPYEPQALLDRIKRTLAPRVRGET